MNYLAIGVDLSVNHMALVVLDQAGQLVYVRYLCKLARDAEPRLGGTRVLPKSKRHKVEDQFYGELYQVERLVWLDEYYEQLIWELTDWILSDRFEDLGGAFVGLEGYAYKGQRTGSNPYQLGEAGALFKRHVKAAGLDMRLHDPTSVKMFATNIGNAPKDVVYEACVEMIREDDCGLDLDRYPTNDKDGGPRADVVDAYVLAKMVQMEVEIRVGRLAFVDLEDGPRRVFNRVTSTHPINILARPWL